MFREGGLRCDFPEGDVRRPDAEEDTLKTVDFVWQAADTTWLVEVKDPEGTPESRRAGAVSDALATLASGKLADEHFLPKLFGTYVWMRRKGILRPVRHRYAVLVGMDPLDAALRNAVSDQIQREIEKVGPLDRVSGIAPIAEVHDLRSWNALAETPEIVREG